MATKNAPAVVEDTETGLAPLAPAPVASMYESVGLSDISLPKIYLTAELSKHAKERLAEPGDLVLATGPDDMLPIHLIHSANKDDYVVMFILGRERFAATTSGGSLEFHPDKKRDMSDPESWEGWFFDVAIPSEDPNVPARWMCWKSATGPAAKAINTMVERQIMSGNYDPTPIKVTVAQKPNKKGQLYWYARVAPTDDYTPEDMEIARELQLRAASLRSSRSHENEAPDMKGIAEAQPRFT